VTRIRRVKVPDSISEVADTMHEAIAIVGEFGDADLCERMEEALEAMLKEMLWCIDHDPERVRDPET
jgi:hypothetical protein